MSRHRDPEQYPAQEALRRIRREDWAAAAMMAVLAVGLAAAFALLLHRPGWFSLAFAVLVVGGYLRVFRAGEEFALLWRELRGDGTDR